MITDIKFLKDKIFRRKTVNGAGMVEYILLVFLIALVAYIGVQQYGLAVRNRWLSANRKVQSAYLGQPGMDR